MWLLGQLVVVFLVLVGISVAWQIIKAPFVWYSEWQERRWSKKMKPEWTRRSEEAATYWRDHYAQQAREMETAIAARKAS